MQDVTSSWKTCGVLPGFMFAVANRQRFYAGMRPLNDEGHSNYNFWQQLCLKHLCLSANVFPLPFDDFCVRMKFAKAGLLVVSPNLAILILKRLSFHVPYVPTFLYCNYDVFESLVVRVACGFPGCPFDSFFLTFFGALQVLLLGLCTASIYLQGCEDQVYATEEGALAAICPSSTVCMDYCKMCVHCIMEAATDSNPATHSWMENCGRNPKTGLVSADEECRVKTSCSSATTNGT